MQEVGSVGGGQRDSELAIQGASELLWLQPAFQSRERPNTLLLALGLGFSVLGKSFQMLIVNSQCFLVVNKND